MMSSLLRLSRLGLALAVALPVILPAFAHEYKKGPLQIIHPWTRVNPKGSTMGAGFLHIENSGASADRLLQVRMDGVTAVTMHESQTTPNGMMRMVAVPAGMAVPAHGMLEFKPGGYHLMLEGLQHDLKAGELISATLVFQRAGAVPVRFKVEPLGATAPAATPDAAKAFQEPGDPGNPHAYTAPAAQPNRSMLGMDHESMQMEHQH